MKITAKVFKLKAPSKNTEAFVSVTIEDAGFTGFFNELTVVNGKNGLFVGYPDYKVPAKDEGAAPTYKAYFTFDSATKKAIETAVLAEYAKA